MDSFVIIHNKWKSYIETHLLPIINKSGELLEGNIYSYNLLTTYNDKYFEKQYNIYLTVNQENVKNILEIGFNSGFSALLMLMSNPTIQITCVDINHHKYTEPCYEFIKQEFKERIRLIIGDSTYILPILTNKFDMVHIDGCHNSNIAEKDIINSKLLLNDNSIIIMDDTDYNPLNILWQKYINNYKLQECSFIKNTLNTTYHTINKYVKDRTIVFYTCYMGNDDNVSFNIPKLPSYIYDCYYFTNNKFLYDKLKNTGWYRILLENILIKDNDRDNTFDSKEIKACPNHFDILKNYKFSCYFDSKININEDRIKYHIDELTKTNKLFILPKHPFINNNVWHEYNVAIKYQKRYYIESEKYKNYINKQLSLGLKDVMPIHYTTHFIIRKNTILTNIINDMWYMDIKECGIECQISFFFIQQIYNDFICNINYCDGYSY